MLIAVLRETAPQETRVAASPETVKKMIAAGHQVVVESGAGTASAVTDGAYQEAGASVKATAAETLAGANIVLKVRAPNAAEVAAMPEGAAVVGLFNAYNYPHFAELAQKNIQAFALELIPRTTRAQAMDVLSSQGNIAGYKAVLLATQYYPRFMPMMMTAAGTVKAAKVLVLGAGVAGLQAIATAKRLGAVVEAFDVRPSAKEQVLSLGGKFVEVPLSYEENAQSDGVYATEMSDDYKHRQALLVEKHAATADIIITTALIPGRPAPRLISAKVVQQMRPGSVIIDMAVEMGGNCELSKPNAVVVENGVQIVGPGNLAGLVAADASALFARNLLNFMQLLLPKEGNALNIDLNDDIVKASLVTHLGKVVFNT